MKKKFEPPEIIEIGTLCQIVFSGGVMQGDDSSRDPHYSPDPVVS
jgi:hypothetical protein